MIVGSAANPRVAKSSPSRCRATASRRLAVTSPSVSLTAMVEGVRERALAAGLIDAMAWQQGIAGLYRTAEAGGTFCYTFFKAVGKA